MFEITAASRIRRPPYYEATLAAGVKGFTPNNQMAMPTGYGDKESEYWRLISGVAQWDVALERQVQITGRDAGRLAQILSPRDPPKCIANQGKYIALCNHQGILINDPVLLKLDEQRYWLSIADLKILFWARAIAAERRLDVEIIEPDVSPLAVHGPKAEIVIASIFGNWVRDPKYFWFRRAEIEGIPLIVSGSGWSKQGGFELYLMDGSKGKKLWNIVEEAGKVHDIGPGNPNMCEGIESGLLSWGSDTDDVCNPYEVGRGKYVNLDVDDDVIGIAALRKIKAQGRKRHKLGEVLEGDQPHETHSQWYDIFSKGEKVCNMTNGVWSYRLKRNVGYALISTDIDIGEEVEICKDGQMLGGLLCKLPSI